MRVGCCRFVWAAALAAGALAARPADAAAQARTEPTPEQLRAVFPGATRFSDKRGRPPAYEAWGADESGKEQLLGYVFVTSDMPPEMTGYNGPIEALVGMQFDGTITGMRVLEYHESLQETRGDFLARRGFQEQFAGKWIGDPFRVRDDLDGISGATITVRALSLGVRNAARRVAAAYVTRSAAAGARQYISSIPVEELGEMSWGEMLEAGLGGQVTAGDVSISLTYLRDEAVGELLMGPGAFRAAVAKVGERVHEHHLMLLGIDGPRALGPIPRVFFVQGADTIRPTQADFVDAGGMSLGKLEGAFRRPGLLLVAHALDVSAPFQIGLGRCCGDPPVTADYVLHEPIPTVAAGAPPPAAAGTPTPEPGAPAATDSADAAAVPPPSAPPAETPPAVDRSPADERGGLSPLARVAGLFGLTGVVIAAVAALASKARRRAESSGR